MVCCGEREKGPTKQSQKWEYITLSDFKATSAWNTAAYAWLWILFTSTIVIYAVDTFTAVNLLIFDKWSSQIQPYIPFEYSKWIFAGCILFSWALWAFEWFRAIRVINRGGVAESYMDPLAVSLQSMRKLGWRRFLVFAALTKSKKGMDLVAFFSYFAFKGSLRIILAEGPRQVINMLTLIAVVEADFVDKSDQSATGIALFWANLQSMYNADKLQAIIIFSMMYSLLIWVISVICLASAAIMYIVFIWHYIPSADGGLSSFCRRKIDKRLEKIVESKVKAGIEDEERKRKKAEAKDWKAQQKAEKKGGAPVTPGIARQATLPKLDQLDDDGNKDTMDDYRLRRTDTVDSSTTTLPPYASRPGTRNEDRLPLPGNGNRPPVVRSATMGSQWTTASYESDAPLLGNAAQPGEGGPTRPQPAFSRQNSNATFNRQNSDASFDRPPMPRLTTSGSQRPYSPAPGIGQGQDTQRPFSPMSRTDFSQATSTSPQYPAARSESPYGGPPGQSNSPFGRGPGTPMSRNMSGPPPRTGTATPMDAYRGVPRTGTATPTDGYRGVSRAATATPMDGYRGPSRAGTATPMDSYRGPSRAGTATPIDSYRGPSRAGTTTSMDNYRGPPRTDTATPTDSYIALPRANTATPTDSYIALPRANTATPTGSYVALPRAGTATPTSSTAPSVQPQWPIAGPVTSAGTQRSDLFSTPLPAQQKSSHSFNRSFASAHNDAVPTDNNSYEMKSNPYFSKSTVDTPSSYVAFNPNRTASPAPQQRNQAPDYFNQNPSLVNTTTRNLTAPSVDTRASIGYSDIVDDYQYDESPAASSHGASTPGETYRKTTW